MAKKIGFVGGMNIPLIKKFEAGYRAGAKRAAEKVEVVASYAGSGDDAFKNPGKGEELAIAQLDPRANGELDIAAVCLFRLGRDGSVATSEDLAGLDYDIPGIASAGAASRDSAHRR